MIVNNGPSVKIDDVFLARRNLEFFSTYAFKEKYPNADFHRRWYNAAQNPKITRVINIAPRNSGKTTVLAKKSPLWLLGRDPNMKILLLSRTSSRAQANLRFIRQSIESNEVVHTVFPNLKPDTPWSDDELTVVNTRRDGESSVLARGLGGSITGFRADLLVVDDLIDKTNVATDLQREKADSYWNEQVLPTLNPDGRVIIVGTRYSNRDWYARMMESEGYKDNLFVFPAFKLDENKELVLDENNQPISYWPQRWSTTQLLERKAEVTSSEGSIAFNCVDGDTLIQVPNGFKMIKDVIIGDLVLTHENNWKSVEYIHKEQSQQPIYKIWVYNEPDPLIITANHKIYSFKSRKYKSKNLAPHNRNISKFVADILDNSLGWVEAENLKERDFILHPINRDIIRPDNNNEEYWWFVGLYLAEGFTGKNDSRIEICLGSHEADLINKTKDLFEKWGLRIAMQVDGSSTRIRVSSMEIKRHLNTFGRYAHGKHLTEEALKLPLNLQRALWDGYYQGDGCVVRDSIVQVSSVSKELLLGFKQILLRLGYPASVAKLYNERDDRTIEGRCVHNRALYRILVTYEPKKGRPNKIYGNYLYSRIRKIEKTDLKQDVYNLQVAADHSYTTFAGTVANCQYMCDPSGYEGMMFKSEWLTFYTGNELMGRLPDLEYVMSVDPNVTAEARSDNTAIVTIAVDRRHNDVYVLDIFAQPLDFISQVKKLRELATQTQLHIGKFFLPGVQHIRKVGVEAIAYQKALSSTGYTMGLPIQEVIHGRTDKVTRLLRIQPHIENGRIKFPDPEVHRDLKWWPAFLDEYLSFPRGRRDDMCLTGETIIETIMGGVRLDSIKIGDMVLTRSGYRKVLWSGLTGIKQVYQLNLIDGRTITGTANHPIYINNVFIRLDAITGADYVWSLQRPSLTMEEPIEDSQIINNEVTESIINVMINGNNHHDIFTKIFGSPTMEKYQKDSQSTTSMETHLIMTQPIYLQCQEENTMECISGNGLINQRIMRNELNISKKYNIKQQNGINLKKEESGIEPITQLTHLKQRKSLPVKNVENNLRKIQPYEKLNSVQKSAVKNTEENQSECANVSFVKTSSSMLEINENEKPVLKNVRVSCIPKLVGINAVYNIEIEDEHEYFANGILVHNCDALEIAISVADLTGGGSSIPFGPGGGGYGRDLFDPDSLGRSLQPIKARR